MDEIWQQFPQKTMKTPFCYLVYNTGYSDGRTTVKRTAKSAILLLREQCDDPCVYYKTSDIEVMFEDESLEWFDLRPFIKVSEISQEKAKEIEDKLDKQIENTYALIKEMTKGGGTITGWFGISEQDKPRVLAQELERARYSWDEEAINNLS